MKEMEGSLRTIYLRNGDRVSRRRKYFSGKMEVVESTDRSFRKCDCDKITHEKDCKPNPDNYDY